MPSSSRLKCHFGCEIDGPLHRFPKPQYPHLTKFNSWKSVLAKDVQDKGDIYIYNQIRICDRHFEKCYHSQSHRLIANAVPTLNIGFSQQQPVEIEVDENMPTLMQPLTSAQMTKVQQSSHSFPNLTVSMPSATRNVANKAETNQSRRDSEDQDSADTSSQQVESLRTLQSTGAPIKKPKQEHRCHTCEEEISDWDELEKHLIQHVSLPSTGIEELLLEYSPPSGNENWSDEDEEPAAVNKLSGLGFTIKKNRMRIKQEPGYNATPESDDLQNINNRHQIKLEQTMETVKVKQEVENDEYQPQQNFHLFSDQIKTERSVTPLDRNNCYTPLIAIVKDDPDGSANQPSQPIFSDSKTAPTSATVPLLPVTKIEDTGPTFIEINIDSNDKDGDDCVGSTTPAPDIKPIVPKIENAPLVSCPSISQSFQSSQPSYNNSGHLSPRITTAPSLEKQHNFNWNAPDSKPHLNSMNILDNTADEINYR